MLGTDFCTAAADVGPEMQPAESFTLAEQRFTTAIEAATRANTPNLLNAARLGRARVRLFMGKRRSRGRRPTGAGRVRLERDGVEYQYPAQQPRLCSATTTAVLPTSNRSRAT